MLAMKGSLHAVLDQLIELDWDVIGVVIEMLREEVNKLFRGELVAPDLFLDQVAAGLQQLAANGLFLGGEFGTMEIDHIPGHSFESGLVEASELGAAVVFNESSQLCHVGQVMIKPLFDVVEDFSFLFKGRLFKDLFPVVFELIEGNRHVGTLLNEGSGEAEL